MASSPPPAQPPLSPTVATPLAHRKRRHSEIHGSHSRPKVSQSQPKDAGSRKVTSKERLQVPSQQHVRGRSVTPVKHRDGTPSSSAAGEKTKVVKANGAASSKGRVEGRLTVSPRPGGVGRPSASPRPNVASRPSVSPRPVVASRIGASPRPGGVGRPSASPRPSIHSRAGASPRPKVSAARRIEDSDDEDSDDGSDIDKSDIEDIVDSAELEPFTLATEDDDPSRLDSDTVASLKQRLLDLGPEDFLLETLDKAQMPPYVLGTAFGLDPNLYTTLGEEIFMRILGQMVMRQYFKRQKLPEYNTLDDVAELLKKCSNIMVIAGAGISTSLGIPDFRSKGSGFYSRALAKADNMGYPISEAEEIFNIETFDENPKLFYALAGDILPDEKRFSPTHAFIKLLQDKGKLLTCYTQNIDNLEQSAGIAKDKLIQCHGSFATATCRRNGVKYEGHRVPGSDIFPSIRAEKVAYCQQCEAELAAKKAEQKAQKAQSQRKKRFKLTPNKRTPTPFADSDSDDSGSDDSPGVMKPDITFFGEQLPNTFFTRFTEQDCARVDLVLVLGTSLKVAPVSEMPNHLPHKVPHVYVSREAIRHVEFDVQCLGDCDDVVVELVRRAGWSGREGVGVLGHEMVEAKDAEGRVIMVEEEDEGEGCRWRVRREE